MATRKEQLAAARQALQSLRESPDSAAPPPPVRSLPACLQHVSWCLDQLGCSCGRMLLRFPVLCKQLQAPKFVREGVLNVQHPLHQCVIELPAASAEV